MTDIKSVNWYRSFHGMFGLMCLVFAVTGYGLGLAVGGALGGIMIVFAILSVLFVAEGILWQFPRFQVEGRQVTELARGFWGAALFMFIYTPMAVMIIFGIL